MKRLHMFLVRAGSTSPETRVDNDDDDDDDNDCHDEYRHHCRTY